jgi:hypothetical protein
MLQESSQCLHTQTESKALVVAILCFIWPDYGSTHTESLRGRIIADAAKIQARRGEDFQISAVGQTIRLGGKSNFASLATLVEVNSAQQFLSVSRRRR